MSTENSPEQQPIDEVPSTDSETKSDITSTADNRDSNTSTETNVGAVPEPVFTLVSAPSGEAEPDLSVTTPTATEGAAEPVFTVVSPPAAEAAAECAPSLVTPPSEIQSTSEMPVDDINDGHSDSSNKSTTDDTNKEGTVEVFDSDSDADEAASDAQTNEFAQEQQNGGTISDSASDEVVHTAKTSTYEDIGLLSPGAISEHSSDVAAISAPASTEKIASFLAPLDSSDPLLGQVLFEDYIVVSVVGSGAASITYEAMQKSQQQVVALKTSKLLQADVRQEFASAAAAHMSLSHKNIVTSLAFLESAIKRPFYIMEFLEGVSLDNVVEATGPLDDEEEIAEVVLQICDALSYAHDNNVVHGNLVAKNVMLLDQDDQMVAKVFDFCFSKVNDKIDELAGRRSPDRPSSASQSFTDQKKNDILNLAHLVIEIVTGRLSAPDETPVETASLIDECPGLMAVNELVEVLNEAMDPDLEWRFESVSDFREEFLSWLEKAKEERLTGPEEPTEVEEVNEVKEVGEVREESEERDTPQAKIEKPIQKNRPKKSIKLTQQSMSNVSKLRRTQFREEDSLASQLSGAFAQQGPRQSPAKSIAKATFKLVASVMIGLLSLTFVILNWNQITGLWLSASTNLSAALPGPKEAAHLQKLEDEANKMADEQAQQTQLQAQAKKQSVSAQAQTNPVPVPPIQRRFRYEENPAYRHWILRDVGPKRRLSSTANN